MNKIIFVTSFIATYIIVDVFGSNWDKSTVSLELSPEFKKPIENVTVAVGREGVLTCSVSNLGRYKVAWVRNDDYTILTISTRIIIHNPRISVTCDNDQRTWILHIRQVKQSDKGCYSCQINTNPIRRVTTCLDVQVSPDINDTSTSTDVTIREGENATLVCEASGRPNPRIQFKREDGQEIILDTRLYDSKKVNSFNGSRLTLIRVDRRQMGAYLCIASNDVPPAVSKRIVLNVNFAPTITVWNRLLGSPLNTDVTLLCYVEAFPATINYWTNNRGEVIISGKKYYISEERTGYKVHMTLTIRNIFKRDMGLYMCIAINSIGRNDGTVRLYEIKMAHTMSPSILQDSETRTTTQYSNIPTSTLVIGALMDPLDNFLPNGEAKPLETILLERSSGTVAKIEFIHVLLSIIILFSRFYINIVNVYK